VTVGALVAGGIAATRSAHPGAAGLLGGVVGSLAFVATVAWSPSVAVSGLLARVAVPSVAPAFGLAFGRIGRRVASAVAPGPTTGANAS
jgi:hypothetical protein